MFVMVSDDRDDWVWEPNSRQQVCPNICVMFHLVEFCRRKRSWFIENTFGNSEFPHVMKERSSFDGLELLLVLDTEETCKLGCINLHTSNVAVCNLVFGVDCHREGFDGRQIE